MFDHLIQRALPRRRDRTAFRISMLLVFVGFAAGALIGSFRMHTVVWSATTEPARVTVSSVALPEEPIVTPIHNALLGELYVDIENESIRVQDVQVLLTGVFDPSIIEHLYLMIDDVQVGEPRVPSSDGFLLFSVPLATLTPGTHRIAIKADVGPVDSDSLVMLQWPDQPLYLYDDLSRPLSYQFLDAQSIRQTVQFVDRGSFALSLSSTSTFKGARSALYEFTATGEPFSLTMVHFHSEDLKADSGRIDIYHGGRFITTAQFVGSDAQVSIASSTLMAHPGAPLFLTFVSVDYARASRIAIDSVTARGSISSIDQTLRDPIAFYDP